MITIISACRLVEVLKSQEKGEGGCIKDQLVSCIYSFNCTFFIFKGLGLSVTILFAS